MAHHDQLLTGDPDALVAHLDSAIVSGSMTAKLEHAVDHTIGDARLLVRVYERYSATGGNRLSLSISVLAVGTDLAVSLVAAGGANAVLFKVNTFGEEAFLKLALRGLEDFTA
jgi:hypothetical protein